MRVTATDGSDFNSVLVNGSETAHTPSMKLLGITIQHNLKWDSHVEAISSDEG